MPEPSSLILETERLALRRLDESDAPFILAHLNEPVFIENIRDCGVRTIPEAEKYLRDGPLVSYARHGFGLYLIELRPSASSGAVPIGMCGLLQRPNLEYPDLGFALDPPYWGQGFAFEAAAAVLAFGHDKLELSRILAITSTTNERSAKLLLRLEMIEEESAEFEGKPARIFLHEIAPQNKPT